MTQFRWLLASLIALAMPGTLAWGQSVINYNDEVPATRSLVSASCDDATRAEKYLEMWQLLWSCELYHEAENLATVAARSCPDSVDLQHALFVSQLVNTERTPEANLPVAASSFDFSVAAFPYPLVDIEESEFGIEIGFGNGVKSDSEQPKACVKGGSKRRCHAHVKPPCVKSCEDMPCGGIVRCQHVECGALAGGLIGTGVGAASGTGLGALIGAIAGRQNACCEATSCCSEPKGCAGCTKSGKDACCCKPGACACAKNCSCGKDASCRSTSGCCAAKKCCASCCENTVDSKKAACACGKDCCCAKKCACGKDCACGGKTVSHCPWLELLRHHPRAAMHILHAPMMPPFVHGMMPPPHMPVGCMPMPSPVMPPLPPPHMPVGCMPIPGLVFPPHVMMPPCPGAAPFAAVVTPNGQFMRWQMARPGMQPAQCVSAPVAVPAVTEQEPVLEQLPMPRQVEVIPGTTRTRNVLVSRPVAGQPMPSRPPLAPVLHHDICPPPVGNEWPDHTVRFHALKNGIHVSNSQFDARCDHATMGDNNRVLLEGNVHIEIRRQHMPACIEAECVAVNLRDGSFEVNPSRAVPMPKALSIPGQPVNRTMFVPGLPMPTMTPCQPPCPELKCYPSPGPQSTQPTPRTGGGR